MGLRPRASGFWRAKSQLSLAELGHARSGGLGVFVALKVLRGYKILISPYFRGSCRFLPSCADYAAEAISRHGLLRGGWLAAGRLARCQPLCASGHDPVPLVVPGFRLREALRRTARASAEAVGRAR